MFFSRIGPFPRTVTVTTPATNLSSLQAASVFHSLFFALRFSTAWFFPLSSYPLLRLIPFAFSKGCEDADDYYYRCTRSILFLYQDKTMMIPLGRCNTYE